MANRPNPIEVGDRLVLEVPVVRVNENDPWSTVTFSLGARQWVTIPQEAPEIVNVLHGSDAMARGQPETTAPGIDNGRRNGQADESGSEPVRSWTVQPSPDNANIEIVLNSKPIALSIEEFAQFALKVLTEAGRLDEQLPVATPLHETDAVLLRTRHTALELHPTDASATIATFAIGKLRLALALDTATFLVSVKKLLEQRRLSANGASGSST